VFRYKRTGVLADQQRCAGTRWIEWTNCAIGHSGCVVFLKAANGECTIYSFPPSFCTVSFTQIRNVNLFSLRNSHDQQNCRGTSLLAATDKIVKLIRTAQNGKMSFCLSLLKSPCDGITSSRRSGIRGRINEKNHQKMRAHKTMQHNNLMALKLVAELQ